MRIPDRSPCFLLCLFISISSCLQAQSADIGLISVDSIVQNSQIGDSSRTFIYQVLAKEQKIFRDSFELFHTMYSKLKESSEQSSFPKRFWETQRKRIQEMNHRLYCMEHLATSIELFYEEEFRYFVLEELREHTPKVKNMAQVSVIVTHKPLYISSENEQEAFFLLPLNQLFIQVVQNSVGFRHRWAEFRQQMTVKIAALKLNMYQHCFNN
jgi:hypothetical protein